MKLLKYDEVQPIEYPEDVAKIKVALNKRGFDMSDVDIQKAYHDLCEDSVCAGWLLLSSWNSMDALASTLIQHVREWNKK